MKRVVIGCVIGVLGILGLGLVLAEEPAATPEVDSQILLTEESFAMSLTPDSFLTAIPTQTQTPAAPIPDTTPEVTVIVEVIEDATADATIEPVSVTTQDVIVLPVPDLTVTDTPSPTLASTQALWSINGQAFYSNRKLGQAFIRTQSFASDGTLLSTSYTDANGLYVLVGLADQVTRVEIDAPLRIAQTLYLAPGIAPAVLTLRAGDLDGDQCVGAGDMGVFKAHFGEIFAGADLDGSGVVDVVDLALLSSNYDESCVPTVIADLTPIATEDSELAATQETSPIATIEPTVDAIEILPTQEVVPIEPTLAPVATEVVPAPEEIAPFEATQEPTAEATQAP